MKNITSILAILILSISLLYAQDSIKIRSGWNNIGAISTRALSQISSEPAGIITSYYFGYSRTGYFATDTLKKGEGYWVKASQAGVLKWGSTTGAPCAGAPTVTYAGKTYNTVEIGTQCWLKENLDVGTMIAGSTEQTNNSTIEKYCYNDNPVNCTTYGGLYQWNEVMQYSTSARTQGICPTGWHIPTNAELMTLGVSVNADGNALKAVGQGTGGGAGTNTSGFSALLSGTRSYDGYFLSIGHYTYFWGSTEYGASVAGIMLLFGNDSGIYFSSQDKAYGFSVRCLQD